MRLIKALASGNIPLNEEVSDWLDMQAPVTSVAYLPLSHKTLGDSDAVQEMPKSCDAQSNHANLGESLEQPDDLKQKQKPDTLPVIQRSNDEQPTASSKFAFQSSTTADSTAEQISEFVTATFKNIRRIIEHTFVQYLPKLEYMPSVE